MFMPRPPLPYAKPPKKHKPALPYTGVGAYLQHFASPDAEASPDGGSGTGLLPRKPTKARAQRRARAPRLTRAPRRRGR